MLSNKNVESKINTNFAFGDTPEEKQFKSY